MFFWPWFDMINVILLILSCFIDVKWKPIAHNDTTTIDELTDTKTTAENQENKASEEYSLPATEEKYESADEHEHTMTEKLS